MALWQIGFFILPHDALDNQEFFNISEEHCFDDSPCWIPKKMPVSMFDPIGSFLPKSKSWADYLIMFGTENSNRLTIVQEAHLIESVSFRIDFTSAYSDVLRQIIEFCIQNRLIILDNDLRGVPLNFEAAKRVVENAPEVKKYNSLL